MKTLPLEFDSKGFTHRQIIREGSVAVYERCKPGHRHHFETIRIGSHNGFAIPGTDRGDGEPLRAEPAEIYPSAEQWGTRGWTFNEESKAMARFEALKGVAK